MGYSTDFVGHIDIQPTLNDAEIAYLTAFQQSRRFWREGGEYAVPGNPRAEECDGPHINTTPPGQPDLWCDWEVCWEGCCLSWSGKEKSYAMVDWLRYLITHFLKPGGTAQGHPGFEEFTFDHELEGVMVGCRRDNKELFQITVRRNRVTEKVLRPADRRYLGMAPLAYEREIDRWEERSLSRRRRPLEPVVPENVVRLERTD